MNDDEIENIDNGTDGVLTWETKGRTLKIKSPSPAFIQNFYAEVTGQTESRSKNFKGSYRIGLSNLEQLHHRIEQTLAPLSIKAKASKVHLAYKGGERQIHSSFDRFRLAPCATQDPIFSLRYEMSAMVEAPSDEDSSQLKERFKKYEISISVKPYVKDLKQEEGELFWLESDSYFQVASLHVEIKFVDFMVSESLMAAVEGWTKTLVEIPSRPIVSFLKKHRHSIQSEPRR
jgi:hypothetical protein